MKKPIIVSILILFSISIMSQSGFRPGFIIKNNGDTLNGQVFYGSNGKFKKSCFFKRFEIAQEVSYSPHKIKGYGFVSGRYFESKTIGRKRTFLECLVKGDVSVYITPGKYKGSVYLESLQTGFFKLEKGSNQLEGLGTFGNFRDALTVMLNKTGSKVISMADVDYEGMEIAAVVRESSFHSENASIGFCQTPRVNNLRDKSYFKESSLLKIELSGGYQFLTVKTTGNDHVAYFSGATFNNSYRPAIGLNINTKFSKISDRWSVDLGLHYTEDSYYGYCEYSDGGVDRFRDDIMIDFSEIQIPVALRLTCGTGNIRPYVKAGGYLSFLIDQTYGRLSEEEYGGSVYANYYEDYELGNASGFIAGAGIQFKLGKARLLSIESLYFKGSQKLSNEDATKNTHLKTGGISIMARINL